MFQFPGFPPHTLCIYVWVTGLQPAGFPHSDIKGSMPACGSPLLFAACHVLLRRLVPWHPPCALLRLITSILRLVTFFRSIDFLIATGLSRLFSSFFLVQLSRCVGDLSPSLPILSFGSGLSLPFGILKTIQMIERQFFLRTLFRALPLSQLSFVRFDCLFYASFPPRNRPRFETSAFASVCSLERR